MGQLSDIPTLHAWAADEAATLVSRVTDARTRSLTRDLDEARKALDAAAHSIQAALARPLQVDDQIGAFVERLTAHAGVDTIRARLQERETENHILQAALTKAQTELDAARTERARTEAARVDSTAMTAEFERALDDIRREHASVVAEQAITCTSLPLNELLTVFNALGKAATVPALLSTLVNALAREFPRVALFDVDGNRLLSAEHVGFDFENGTFKLAVPLSVDSLLTRAVRTGRLEILISGLRHDPGISLPFGGTPGCAVAIPIVVQGAITAVIYADDSDHAEFAMAEPQTRAKFAEILQQYALLVLLKIWIDQRGVAELREFAAKLVADLEYAYTVDAEAGRNRLQCQQRLKDDVETARKRYSTRASPDNRSGADLLDEHLAAAARTRKDTSFGKDLAAVLAPATRAPRGGNVVTLYR